MSLKKKNENNMEAICISSIYENDNIEEESLVNNTYANMQLTKSQKALSVFIYYSRNFEIKKINFKILTLNDKKAQETEILKMAEYLSSKRKLLIKSKRIGRNELCPCGSREEI